MRSLKQLSKQGFKYDPQKNFASNTKAVTATSKESLKQSKATAPAFEDNNKHLPGKTNNLTEKTF